MSDLRDPELDPDYMLEPERLIDFERAAEPARCCLQRLPPEHMQAVRAWISAELEVARKRAQAVGDYDFSECVGMLERRLCQPGSFLRDAEATLKIRKAFESRARFRVIDGGGSGQRR